MRRIEICTNGYQSVINAQENGADCAELCESLEVGGVTPSYGTLKKVAADMRIPVRVLSVLALEITSITRLNWK